MFITASIIVQYTFQNYPKCPTNNRRLVNKFCETYILEYYASLNIFFKEFLITWRRAHVKYQGKKPHSTIYIYRMVPVWGRICIRRN